MPIFHSVFSHFQNIDSFLQSPLGLPPPDPRLDPIPCHIIRMLAPIALPIIRPLSPPIPLRLLVIGPILFLPAALTEAFLFPLAIITTARLLTTPKTMLGNKTDRTPNAPPLPHDCCHDKRDRQYPRKDLCYSQNKKKDPKIGILAKNLQNVFLN